MAISKSYYFQHDYNAHTDIKLLFVRQQLGMEGYGIYWYILEQLAISGGKMPLKIVPVLSMQMQTTETKVKAVIEEYGLFQIIENEFFSARLNDQLEFRNSLSAAGKRGALNRWANRGAIGEAISTPNAKERKGKESKVNISPAFQPPQLHEVINLMMVRVDDFTAQGEADKFINFYQSKGWMVGKNKMKDWRAAARNWLGNVKPKETVELQTKIKL